MTPSSPASSGEGPPEAGACEGASDVGQLYHNQTDDIWYECVFDPRHSVFTWAITPSTESPLDDQA